MDAGILIFYVFVKPSSLEVRVNSVQTLSSYLKENTRRLFIEIIIVYSEIHMKTRYTFCGQTAKLLNIKAGRICS
jgi:hypothetical protein